MPLRRICWYFCDLMIEVTVKTGSVEEYTSEGKAAPEGVDPEETLLGFYKKNMAVGRYVFYPAYDGDKIVGTRGMSFTEKPPYEDMTNV